MKHNYKNRNMVEITVSSDAKRKIPDGRTKRNEYMEKAIKKYIAKPPRKEAGRLNRYEAETLRFDCSKELLSSLQETNPKIPVCNMVNDAILRA